MADEPTFTVSFSRKINLGNFESADMLVSMSGLRVGMSEEEMLDLLETSKIGWDLVRANLAEQVRRTRQYHDGPCPICAGEMCEHLVRK